MNEIIEYAPVVPAWQAGLVNVTKSLHSDDIVKMVGTCAVAAVIAIACVCFSGSELSIANGKFEIKRPTLAT